MRGHHVIATAFVLATACSHPEEPPKPLERHFDEINLAPIPVDRQQPSFDAQHEWTISRAENAKAEADLHEATMQLGIARNDQKSAHLSVENALSAKKVAAQSADLNRENQAQRDLAAAEDNEKAAAARVKYLQTYVEYMKVYALYTLSNMYWHEAKFEATKARIAKENNIQPRGVQYDVYPKQLDARTKRATREREKAEKHKSGTMTARKAWMDLQHKADTQSGRQTTAWDPMMNNTAATATAGAGAPVQVIEPKSGPVAPPPVPVKTVPANANANPPPPPPAPPPAPAPAPEPPPAPAPQQ